jgi:hypothetical protein
VRDSVDLCRYFGADQRSRIDVKSKGDFLSRASLIRKFCAVARTPGLDLSGNCIIGFGGDLPPEITWGRRALAMAYKWLGRGRW